MIPTRELSDLIHDRRIIVCVGTGGAGKTTVAAALALAAARLGRRALVITIDPARRLADALGQGELGNEPQMLDLAVDDKAAAGRVSAMMLDMKRTFDDLVDRFAEGPEAKERILQNPIYQHVSDALAGSAEYAAMEKVYELSQRADFDLIVVDTPPSQHALDFLESPRRLLDFLDSRMVQLLLHPAFAAGRFGFKLFHRSAQRAFRIIERVSGLAFLEDISEFLLAFEGMSEGFRARAGSVRALLLGPEAAFVLVAGASSEASRNATEFLDALESSAVPLAGVIVNRVRLWPGGGPAPTVFGLARFDSEIASDLERLGNALEGDRAGDGLAAARAAVDLAKRYASLVRVDEAGVAPLRSRCARAGWFLRCIPELPHDVHDLGSLTRIGRFLFTPGSERDDGEAA